MKYDQISNQLFCKNRKKFTQRMKPHAIAFFNSNDIYPISADSTLPFAQHRDIFYLSGIDQEESILVLFPDAIDDKHKEILFIRETNEHIKIWEGEKLSKERATQVSGIQTIYWLTDFDNVINRLMSEATTIYANKNEHYRASSEVQTREDRFIKKITTQFPLHSLERSNPILQDIRGIKEPEEITLIQQACDITEKGFRRILSFVKPGVGEYEIEAEFIHEFIKNKSDGFAYTPIIASGFNACVLHYIENNQICQSGDLLLLDVGAAYANYASDMTRTIPVNGRFTDRQKAVYNAVLRVKEAAASLLVEGNNWYDYHQEVGVIMTKELIGLGLLTEEEVKNQDPALPAYKKYFMHGTSHHMGLDTHDYGNLRMPFTAGMVFTVEPGIYIPEENMGIRLEDNYEIQKNAPPKNLMKNIPITVEEIEQLMNV